jgi:UDP-sugar transporter A1/2/3
MQKSVSILQLMGGIMFFQYSVMRATPHTATATSADVKAHSAQSPLLGMAAMILSCLVSGFAGVYTEKIVKKAKTSVWTSNLQLALCSLGPASFPIIASYIRSTGSEFNLFQGFTSWTWFVVALNLCGGLLVGMTVKYANSILKSFATSFALILTFLFSFAFLDASFSYLSALSVLIVVSAIVVYSRPEAAKSYSTEVSPLSSPILEVTDLFDVVTSKDHRAISIQ